MGKETGISWTDHTFNAWHGCTKVSPACDHCYAETTGGRFGTLWGDGAARRFMGDKYWAQPIAWNRAAVAEGVRRRVFAMSMGDVFEDRPDLVPHRARLFSLVEATPGLDWLFLSKRPENFAAMLPWLTATHELPAWRNVWLGVTAENDEQLRRRVPILRATSAAVRFISCEPILEGISPEAWHRALIGWPVGGVWPETRPAAPPIDWLIVGDESGNGKRPAELEWIRDAREVARASGVAFHLKQWNGPEVPGQIEGRPEGKARKIHLPILDGKQWAQFPGGQS